MVEGAMDIGLSTKYIYVIFVMTMFTFSFGYAISRYQNAEIDTDDLNANLLMRRVVYSSECFAYEDNNRVVVGELDKEKLSSERLKNCFPANYAVKVSINNEAFYNDEVKFNGNKNFCKFEDKVSCNSGKECVFINANGERQDVCKIIDIEVIKDF